MKWIVFCLAALALGANNLLAQEWHDQKHDAWIVVVAKADTSIVFFNSVLFLNADAKTGEIICSQYSKEELLWVPFIPKLLPFIAVGDTIRPRFYHEWETDNLGAAKFVAINVDIMVNRATEKGEGFMGSYQAVYRGQEIEMLVDLNRDPVPDTPLPNLMHVHNLTIVAMPAHDTLEVVCWPDSIDGGP